LRELENFIKKVSEYDFLKQDIKEGYHDNQEFISTSRQEYIAILDKEVRSSMGVFESSQYEDFLKKYIFHLNHLIKKESVKNAITGKTEPADANLIEEFETIIDAPSGAGDRENFRNNVISAIGAWSLDHPNEAMDYRVVFPDFMKKLEDHYFNQQKAQMTKLKDAVEFFGTEKEDKTTDHYALAKQTITTMEKRYGYCEECARQAVLFLVKTKY
jgi:predicted Ser/Thr protein kinase